MEHSENITFPFQNWLLSLLKGRAQASNVYQWLQVYRYSRIYTFVSMFVVY